MIKNKEEIKRLESEATRIKDIIDKAYPNNTYLKSERGMELYIEYMDLLSLILTAKLH